ncbi:WD repeat- and FYVE domain-containing protein 4 isoform X3 [Pongo pygmaeus]|uniref:WD repeat- and FYVE domain-containing protein 4 isoform X3 n=1 Tax=Pongo pygmaeus TaxID=9600 RepID=UPI0023E31A33|nr:WD repeat- and FYVE domain-containing protein 4 isoform X3 [Pongo pygmaeus]
MEAEDLSKAEDRNEDPGSKNEGQLAVVQPDVPHGGQSPSPTALWDMLERKFLEYQQLTHKSPIEHQKSLLSLLPLFLKAWEHSVGIICFPSLQRLAEDVSDQLAQQLQQALVGKPAEQARLAAGQLLWWKGDMDQDGYLLLKSAYVLTGTDSETLGRVAESGLPALLLQCLYLFFVFPLDKDELFESDLQVQKMFVQMLLNICSDSQGLEGLLSGSELQSLLIATTCLREHSCCFWKEPTFCVLRAISKAQNLSIIQYLQATDCVRLSLQNLCRLTDTLPAPEVSEAVSLILGFVKDSYPVSSALFLEFESSEGYPLLLKVLLRYDGLTQNEVDPQLEELLGLVVWLTTCGRSELKVFDSVTYPQLEGFKFHHEASGVTVKNLQAFQVLQNVFHKASDSVLCIQVLSAIRTMWAWNARNFFLLEWTLQPISQFVEIMPLKPAPVQEHFFQLLEALVFELHYVPHEILRKVQHLIKESPGPSCTLMALKSILSIAGGDPLFTDIFRDSGLLGLLLAQLRKQAKIMRKSGNKVSTPGVQDPERELTCVMLRTVVTLLKGSVRNAVVLKDHGMVPFIKIFLDDECYREASLSILEQLSAINAEEYMSIIVGALCSSTQGELQLKLDLLKSLLRILETPKGRAAFRVSSGFNGLLSLLSDLEGSLQEPLLQAWGSVSPRQTLELVLYTLCAVSAALHWDPVNGDFFRRNGLFEKMAEDLCLLGCFGALEEEGTLLRSWADTKARPFVDLLGTAFSSSGSLPPRIQSCLQILGFLDSMASGTLHLRGDLKESLRAKQGPVVDAQKGEAGSDPQRNFKLWPDLEERMDEGDAAIMHPGVVCIMVRLLPRLYHEDHPQMLYIQSLPGPFLSMDPSAFVDVYGYIATPRVWKQKSSLIWRLGPTYLFEESISMETLEVINKLGPRYCGNFQAVHVQGEDPDSEATPLIAEERVSFGLHIASSSITSVADIRNAYNEVDSRLIAKEMNISSRDNAMPVFLLRNCAGHLSGSLRTIGAVAVGQLGVRIFHSSPAASSLDFIGGPAILLGLISLATDDHTMYAAVKVLHSVLTSNAMCDFLMQHICGYQIMAFLLRKKASLLNHRIFQLILSVAGTVELGFRSSAITNTGVFQHILCNFELWMNTADNLELSLFSHLLEILQSPREGPRNAEAAHQAQLIPKLIFLFNEPSLIPSKIPTIIGILACQLRGHFSTQDLLRIGLFVVYTLKPSSVNERQICMDGALDPSLPAGSQTSGKTIWLRNQLLEMLLSVISSPQLHLSSESKEEMFLKLGPDWFLLLLQGHLHASTTVLALKLLLHFLASPSLRTRFRDGLCAGSWVERSTEGVDIVMDNLKSQSPLPEQSPCLLPGFRVLNDFLAHHVHIPEVYLIVSTFFLQTPLTELTDGPKDSLDAMLQWLLQRHRQEEVLQAGLCTEGALLLLEMLKAIMSQPLAGSEDGAWAQTFLASVLQFLSLVHRTYPQDTAWRAPEFLQTLAIAAFPLGAQKGAGAESTQNTSSPEAAAEGDSTVEGLQAPTKAHPARRQLREFMQLLLRELLLGAPSPKQCLPLEVLLEASPDHATSQQKRDFQSEVLLSAMEIFHMTSGGDAAMFRDGKEPRPSAEAAAAPSLANISCFTQKLVEKLYSGMFSADPRHILLFILEHIMVVIETASSQRDTVLSTLYSSLNKVILYCLSKPQQSLSECLSLLSILGFLQEHWDVVFATYNSNVSFLLCLMHCLLLLNERSYPEGFGLEPRPRLSTYHQVFLSPNEDVKEKREDLPSLSDVQHNIQKTVQTLWQQLVAQRQQTLEDAFKIDLSVKPGEREVKIEEVTPLWEETMLKAWQHYLASEKKSLASRSNVAHHSKVTLWSGSLSSAMKLMPGRQAKDPECKTEDFVSCIENYRRRGQELYASLYKDHVQRRKCDNIKAANAWARIQEQLFGELGLWSQGEETKPCSPWELDWREGPARMRKRIKRLSPLEALSSGRHKESQDKNDHISQTNAENQDELTPREAEGEPDEVGVDCTQLTFFPALHESLHSEDFLELCRERQVILQELLDKEKVTQKFSLVIVQGHLVSEGVLLFGHQHFYICENFTLSPTGDVYCTRHCLSNISDPFIFNLCSKDRSTDHYSCQCHSYTDMRELRQARFLLQEIALEIFFHNGYSKFLVFYNNDRSKAFKSFCSFQPSLKGKAASEDPLNLRRYPGSDRTMLQKWQKRDISNFEYLMYLNTAAGRTYNDYMQYPVFPWVLADYTSETLNLANPKTFRDLSKPMGAQTKERKLKFIQRFKEVEKTEGDMTVQCHYYTHYSSAIIVASYLVRMPPFTQAFCALQGGSFDVADRMFHSVKSTWESASRENMSDVRELTPEFFYLPEFLTNCNGVEFGCMQDGTVLGDVQLPPWADGDPRKFISLHRQALESDFVSANLQHWIDLIFGYKQQGPAAVDAVNIFHPYFYGDRMNLSSITDPLIKSTILGFVSNFGQVPKQLFTKPHPARTAAGKPLPGKDVSTPVSLPGHPQPFFYSLQSLRPSQVTVKDMYLFSLGSESPRGAIGHIVPTEKTILAVERNKVLLPPLWNRTFSWGFDDFSCCLGSYGSDKILMTFENLAAWGRCLCAVCPSPTMIVTSGTSTVVCVWELSMTKGRPRGLRLRQALYGHTQAVTCLAASVTFSLLVSGSQDCTCILWDLDHLTHVTRLPTHREGISAIAISDVSGTIVSCAGAHLSLWNVNGQPLASITTAWGPEGAITCCCLMEGPAWDTSQIIITGSQDGMVRVWKTEDVKMSVPGRPAGEEPPAQPPSPRGHKWEKNLALSRELDVSTALTGKPSKTSPAVTALAVSRNQTKLLVGDERGRIFCWSADG